MKDENEVLEAYTEQEESATLTREFTKSSTSISICEETAAKSMKGRIYENVNENTTDDLSITMDSRAAKPEELFPLLLTQPCTSSSTKEEEMDEKQEASHSDPSGSDRIAPTSNTASFSGSQGNQSSLEMKPIVHDNVSEREDEENTLGPLDVLSFAWQISRGMV